MRVEPRTSFEWPIYADATLAGLSVLVPVPFVDDVSESFFRRRMVRSVARARGVALPEEVRTVLTQGEGWLASCLSLPLTLTVGLLKRLSRKLLYFLTVKQASEKLSHYWHRAFLLDYMIAAGHLETVESARAARGAMEDVLRDTASPLRQVAGQVITRARHVRETLRRGRQGEDDEVMAEARDEMASQWSEVRPYLLELAARYDARYRETAAVRAP